MAGLPFRRFASPAGAEEAALGLHREGAIFGWVNCSVPYRAARVKPGRIMFEIDGVPVDVAKRAMELAAAKLPLATKFVTRLGEEH